jgi:hypothetical protein
MLKTCKYNQLNPKTEEFKVNKPKILAQLSIEIIYSKLEKTNYFENKQNEETKSLIEKNFETETKSKINEKMESYLTKLNPPTIIYFVALFYYQKYDKKISFLEIKDYFSIFMMFAYKMFTDTYYKNFYYFLLFDFNFSFKSFNKLERLILKNMDYQLFVKLSDFEFFFDNLICY